MDRVVTYVANQQVFAADLNEIQDRIVNQRVGTLNNTHTLMGQGALAFEWMHDSDLADGTLCQVDDGVDFRDRILTTIYINAGTANQRPGESDDYRLAYLPKLAKGYTGRGALNAAGTADPSAGDPPLPALGTSWAFDLDGTGIWLYADASDGSLWMYNETGFALRSGILTVIATPPTGKRP